MGNVHEQMRALVLLTLLAVASPAQPETFWYSAMSQSDSVRNTTETKVFSHHIGKQAEGARLRVTVKLSSGEADVKLIDGQGTQRFDQLFHAGKANVEETFKGAAGDWQVRVDFKGATGRYAIKLVAF